MNEKSNLLFAVYVPGTFRFVGNLKAFALKKYVF